MEAHSLVRDQPALSARLAVVVASDLGVWVAQQAWGDPALLREWITVGRCARAGHTDADGRQRSVTDPYQLPEGVAIVPGATDRDAPLLLDQLCRCAERYVPAPPLAAGVVCGLPPPSGTRGR